MGLVVLVHNLGEIVVVFVINSLENVKLFENVEGSKRLIEFVGIGVEELHGRNMFFLRSGDVKVVADKENSEKVGHQKG